MKITNDATSPVDPIDPLDGDPTETLHVRVPSEMISQLDLNVREMRGMSPGIRISRSDAARTLLRSALRAKERDRNRNR